MDCAVIEGSAVLCGRCGAPLRRMHAGGLLCLVLHGEFHPHWECPACGVLPL